MNTPEINSLYIKISGKMPTEKMLEMGEEYKLSGTFEVVQLVENNNQDGTVDVTYKLKALSEVEVV